MTNQGLREVVGQPLEVLFVFKLQMCNAKCEMRNVLRAFYGIVCKIFEVVKL
jgi:hypothetical protein